MLVAHRPKTIQATRRKYNSSGPRIFSPGNTTKILSIRDSPQEKIKPVHPPTIASVITPKEKERTASSLRLRLQKVNISNQPTPITFPMADIDQDPTAAMHPSHVTAQHGHRFAMLQRVMLRPRSLHNYDREKSIELIKKTNALAANLVPNCFRNYRARLNDHVIQPNLSELIRHHRRL